MMPLLPVATALEQLLALMPVPTETEWLALIPAGSRVEPGQRLEFLPFNLLSA
ncbi:MAG: hypothetical protein GYB41_02095 [Oceanospirillales bacterium]|uniref:Uncharacterized protein n=1 Tax=Marinobacterium halophilum TaxID=267374 RepID=A0A2P8EXW6_9GAMM|nr:hypothetical protein [Marinobacterium halophilum]MBR9827436.1 hypothetical protein [Oceanospirillales bacterium]PSL14307.1 hypothetical protein CLV44_10830 [Marinobacterium halophilum]